jgi:hypothetical protein
MLLRNKFMSATIQATAKKKQRKLSPKEGGRGNQHKDEPRDKVVRIRTSLFKEMSESELGRKFNVDFDDICSEVWEYWKENHAET